MDTVDKFKAILMLAFDGKKQEMIEAIHGLTVNELRILDGITSDIEFEVRWQKDHRV